MNTFSADTGGKEMKWEKRRRQFHRQPPLGGLLDFTPGLAWLLAGLRTRRHGRCGCDRRFYSPIFPVSEKTSDIGLSFLLTAAGQFRIRTGFPLTFPWERHQQAKHKIECCLGAVNLNVGARLPHHFRGLRVSIGPSEKAFQIELAAHRR